MKVKIDIQAYGSTVHSGDIISNFEIDNLCTRTLRLIYDTKYRKDFRWAIVHLFANRYCKRALCVCFKVASRTVFEARILNIKDKSPEFRAIAALLITFFVGALFAQFSFKKRKSDTILLAGLSGSGKTALFYQLRDGSIHKGTVTSMEANIERFPLHTDSIKQGKAKTVRLSDFPGHMKLRAKLDEYLKEAGAIIFLVDAADFIPNVRANAEYLYDVLSKALVVKYRIPILVVANKMDKVTAHSTEFVCKQIEKEIDKLRVTRTAVSEADMTSEVSIGKEGVPFKFTHCVNKVMVTEASVVTGQMTDIYQFIREQVIGRVWH
ncbi:hypothetical protein GOP47_0011687 [Adiantum capillus-veneris]|uniref:Signal recognition particle receptor subunit beta n=1 Tax=Adiantum capillus-veneris TaxID=13818 RepID=A0A9D4ZFM3_ADICA|nr:hypothetical protein GOP47_0011687 [Adiantum capillus-veneris]